MIYPKKAVLEAIKEDGYLLECVGKKFQVDKEGVLAAVKNNGRALPYANNSLQNDPEFMKEVEKYSYWTNKEEFYNYSQLKYRGNYKDGQQDSQFSKSSYG